MALGSTTTSHSANQPAPLGPPEIVTRITGLIADGRCAEAVPLIEQQLLHCWFHLTSSEFLALLDSLHDSGVQLGPISEATRQYLTDSSGSLVPGQQGSGHPSTDSRFADLLRAPDLHTRLIAQTGAMLRLRISGHPVRALEAGRRIEVDSIKLGLLHDHSHGWQLFGPVQHGLTAMLAGDFQFALTKYSEAQMLPRAAGLEFLHRDAYVRSALLHAAAGTPGRARSLLAQAECIPRTSSWMEASIDESVKLTEVFLDANDVSAAAELLDSVHMNALGELWPFYPWAIFAVFSRSGYEAEAEHRLESLAALPFARQEGEGLSGSITSLLLARLALKRGDTRRAQQLLRRADTSYIGTKLLKAELLLAVGHGEPALQIAESSHRLTRGLQQFDHRRTAIILNAGTPGRSRLTEQQLLLLHYLESDAPRERICHDLGLTLIEVENELFALQQLLGAPTAHDTLHAAQASGLL